MIFTLLLLALFSFFSSFLHAQDIKISTSPNPVSPGKKLRFSLFLDMPILRAKIRFEDNTAIFFKPIDLSLYTTYLTIPENRAFGTYKALLVIETKSAGIIRLPVEYVVGEVNSDSLVGQGVEFGNAASMDVPLTTDLNLKIDDLEQELDKMAREKSNLENRIKDLEDELKKLKDTDKDRAEIEKKQALLDALQKKLEEQQAELEKQSKELREKFEQLAKAEDSIKEREEKLKEKEEEVKKSESEVKEKQEELKKKEANLKDLEISISNRGNELENLKQDLEELKQNVDSKSSDIEQKQKEIQQKEQELSKLDQNLIKTKSELIAQRQALDIKSSELSQREKTLIEMAQDLTAKSETLELMETKLVKGEAVLSKEKAIVEKEKQLVLIEQEKVKEGKQEISAQRQQLVALSQEIESKRSELENEIIVLSRQNQKESDALKSKRSELLMLEDQLNASKSQLVLLESEQQAREKRLNVAASQLEAKEKNLEDREFQLEVDKANVEGLRQEIITKFEQLDELRKWILKKDRELRTSYLEAKQTSELNTVSFEEQYAKLETLTRLLQDKNRSLEDMNRLIQRQNQSLIDAIDRVVEPDYQYAISPFLGYHQFNDSVGFGDSVEGGIRLIHYLNNRWFFQTHFSVVSALSNASNGGKKDMVTFYGLNAGYSLPIGYHKIDAYYFLGLAGDLTESLSAPFLSFGGGVTYPLSKDLSLRLELAQNRDRSLAFGFDKKMTFLASPKSVLKLGAEVEAQHSLEQVTLHLSAPGTKTQYLIDGTDLVDMASHWALDEATRITSLGLMGYRTEDGRQYFDPAAHITRADAAKLFVLTRHYDKIMSSSELPITFTIIDLAVLRYNVDLDILDSNKRIVRRLVSGTQYAPGDYTVRWDGRNDDGELVSEGDYQIRVRLYTENEDETVTFSTQKHQTVVLKEANSLQFSSDSKRVFDDVDVDASDYDFIAESVKLGVFDAPLRTGEQNVYVFNPNLYITRLQFISAVSKVLYSLGARNLSQVDLSPYRDIDRISDEARDQLKLYIAQLGYGGDAKKQLRPNDYVTKAEAAIVLDRLLNWRAQRTTKSL